MSNETEDKDLAQNRSDEAKNTMLEMEKKYPGAVMVKKGLVVLAIVVGFLIGGLIVTNIYRSSHPTKESATNEPAEVANIQGGNAADWYKEMRVQKLSVVNDAQKSAVVQTQAQANTPGVEEAGGKVNGNTSVSPNKTTDEEMKKILSAPISSNQINFEIGPSRSDASIATPSLQTNGSIDDQSSKSDQNMQSEKKAFVRISTGASDDYLHEILKNPISHYEVKAGAIIPAILITGINSDLPGQITAEVRQNVYDTISGKYVLIPQGAKLTGLYDSQIAYGQERVLIVWKRIIFPNGQSINLEGMPGVDMSGYAGFNDQVNNHYGKIFGSVILMSVISAGAQLSQPQNNNNNINANPTVNQALAASLGTNIMNTANSILQKNLNVQPTLVIRPGYLMNISVTKDIVFPKEYEEGTTYDD